MKIQKPLLRKKILKMVIADLNIQRAEQPDDVLWNKKTKEHVANLKKIISKHGWPTIRLVGKKASWGAWLLAQHADSNKAFQKYALKLMKKEAKKNPKNVVKRDIAFLTDRILINAKKKQVYGSQFRFPKNKGAMPFPIKDIKNLEKRRKEYGLPPFKDYLDSAKEESERMRKKEKRKITVRIVI